VEALTNLEGSIRHYIAADVNGQANAAARVRAQCSFRSTFSTSLGSLYGCSPEPVGAGN